MGEKKGDSAGGKKGGLIMGGKKEDLMEVGKIFIRWMDCPIY